MQTYSALSVQTYSALSLSNLATVHSLVRHFPPSKSLPTLTVRTALNMTPSLPKTYKQAAFKELGGPLVVEEVELKLPEKGEVLVKVEACGVCHSDIFVKANVYGVGLLVFPSYFM